MLKTTTNVRCSPIALVLLSNSQELVSASGLTPGRADECECTESLSSLQLCCGDTSVCSRNKSRQRVALSSRRCLCSCPDLGRRVVEGFPHFWVLSLLCAGDLLISNVK